MEYQQVIVKCGKYFQKQIINSNSNMILFIQALPALLTNHKSKTKIPSTKKCDCGVGPTYLQLFLYNV